MSPSDTFSDEAELREWSCSECGATVYYPAMENPEHYDQGHYDDCDDYGDIIVWCGGKDLRQEDETYE